MTLIPISRVCGFIDLVVYGLVMAIKTLGVMSHPVYYPCYGS